MTLPRIAFHGTMARGFMDKSKLGFRVSRLVGFGIPGSGFRVLGFEVEEFLAWARGMKFDSNLKQPFPRKLEVLLDIPMLTPIICIVLKKLKKGVKGSIEIRKGF